MADDKHIVRTADVDWSKVWRGRHPFNPASEMKLVPLGDAAGLQRVGVSLIRIPPGKESFIPHAHALQEEFVFILEGAGEAVLDGVRHAVGPGDFLGFPTDGVVHSLVCTGPGDLVYLTGGERSPVEVAEMPSIGATQVMSHGRLRLFRKDGGGEDLSLQEWMARTRVDD
jgi:uncharacterized cupin superfamily protein